MAFSEEFIYLTSRHVGGSLRPASIELFAGNNARNSARNKRNFATAILLKILEKQDLSETDRTLDVALTSETNPETNPEIPSCRIESALEVVVA